MMGTMVSDPSVQGFVFGSIAKTLNSSPSSRSISIHSLKSGTSVQVEDLDESKHSLQFEGNLLTNS